MIYFILFDINRKVLCINCFTIFSQRMLFDYNFVASMLSSFCIICAWVGSSQIIGECYEDNISLPIPLSQHLLAYFESNQSIYLLGGETTDLNFTSSIYKWDITKSFHPSFELMPNITTPTEIFTSRTTSTVVIDNYAYFIGIYNGSYNNSQIYRLDIDTQTWDEDFTQMPFGAVMGCVTTNDTHIFMVGGRQSTDVFFNYVQVYDISKDNWIVYNHSELYPKGVATSMCNMINNVLYIFGGLTTTAPGVAAVYSDIFTIEWPQFKVNRIGDLSTAIAAGALVNHCDHDVIIIGGIWTTHFWVSSRCQLFNIDSGSVEITDVATIPTPAAYMTGVILHDKDMYIFGGTE